MLKLTNFNELALAIMLECWNYLHCFFIPEKTFFKIFYLSEFSTSNTFKYLQKFLLQNFLLQIPSKFSTYLKSV